MSTLQFKLRLTKTAFEQRLVNDLGADELTKRRYQEEGVPMTLYYKDNVHAGTWQSGKGWAFKSVYA